MGFSLGDLWSGADDLSGGLLGLGKSAVNYLLPQTGTPQQPYLDSIKKREQGTFDQQGQLSNLLFAQAQGQGPSVAGAQLGQGLDLINRGQMAQAAGANGQNGVLARYQAMQAAAQQGAALNQQQAIARAQETAHAQALLGQNLGNQAGESSNMYGTVSGAANTSQLNNNNEKNKLLTGITGGLSDGLGSLAFV